MFDPQHCGRREDPTRAPLCAGSAQGKAAPGEPKAIQPAAFSRTESAIVRRRACAWRRVRGKTMWTRFRRDVERLGQMMVAWWCRMADGH
jgi:hypothetical protein